MLILFAYIRFDTPDYIRYRFRLVSVSCDPSFVFSIDNHQFTVIEVEGTNVQPLVVDSIELFAGMRDSISPSALVTAS